MRLRRLITKAMLRKAVAVASTFLAALGIATFSPMPANAALAYNFTSWKFTPCGQTGRLGPSLAQCQTAYASSSFASDANYFAVDAQGQQWFKPPVTAYYRLEIAGAAGGGTNGGKGEVVQDTILLDSTKWYCMAIGQKGVADTISPDSGGGGGSTWMVGGYAVNTGGNCANAANINVGGGGGGGTTAGADAQSDLSAGNLYVPSTPATGRGAGKVGTGTDVGQGGPLTGSSGRSGAAGSQGATGAYIGSTVRASAAGSWGMSGAIGGGYWVTGLTGGNGGFPNGGASCDCTAGGGGGGGGGGYSPGGGGGYNADGTGGGGGGGSSITQHALSPSYPAYNLGATNAGDGYININYLASTSTDTSLVAKPAGTAAVGSTLTANVLSFASVDAGSTTAWKWQTINSLSATAPGGSLAITDIPGAPSSTLVLPASTAGQWVRTVQIVTDSDGNVSYFPSAWTSTYIAGSHSITGTPPDTFKGDTLYSFTFGLAGYAPTSATSWSRVSGTLPTGMSLSTAGVLSGTPSTAGTYTFTVGHNNNYETATQSFTMTIWPNVTMAATQSFSCVWQNTCTQQISATSPNSETLSYSIQSGSLPAGLTMDSSGLITGTYSCNCGSLYVYIKAAAPSGAYAVQKVNFTNTLKTGQAAITFTVPSAVTWNPASPPTGQVTWTTPAPGTGIVHININTPTICSAPTGTVTSPTTLTALAPGICNFDIVEDGDATYYSGGQSGRQWTIGKMSQAPTTMLTQTAGSLNWDNNGTTVTVQGSGGTGTGSFVYSTVSNATICTVDSVTGVVTWLTFGSCTVQGYRAADATYGQGVAAQLILTPIAKAQVTPVTVANAPASVAWASSGTFTVTGSGGDFPIGATPSYTYQSLTTTICTVNSSTGTVTTVNAGTCQLQAKANAVGSYLAGVYGVTTTVEITGTAQAAITLTANSGNAITWLSNGTFAITIAGGSGTGAWSWSIDSSSSTVCTGTGSTISGTVTMKNPGTCLVNVTHGAQGGYTALTQQFSVAIGLGAQAVVSATFSPTTITYTTPTAATSTITGSGGSGTGTYSYAINSASTAICSISGNLITALGAGTCQVDVKRLGDSTYADSAVATKSLTINKASQSTVTITANRTTLSPSDTTPLTITAAGGSGTGAYVYATSTTQYCTIDSVTGVVTAVALGTCSVTATRAADSNYNVSSASTAISIAVTKMNQTALVASSTTTSTTFGSGTFTVSTSGGSGTGAVTYASGNTGICTVVAATGVTTIVSAGSCVITATKAADTNYLVATASVTITIAKATQATFTASTTKSSVTIGATTGITVSAIGGSTTNTITYASGDTNICTVASNGIVTVLTAGSCVITATRPGNTNYNDATSSVTITIAKTSQTALIATANRTTGTYGDGLSYSVSSSGGSGTGATTYSSNSTTVCSIDASTGAVTILSAGTCSITATKAGDSSYADATATATITISKATQASVTASVDDAAPAYTESPKATVQVSYTGGSGTGSVSYSTSTPSVCSVDATGLVTDITKGKCIVTVTIAEDTNYNATSASVTIRFGKVDQATLTASANTTSVTYLSGTAVTVSAIGGSGAGSVSYSTSSANCSVNSSTGVVTYTGAGDCVVVATKAGDIDYAEAADSVTISVGKATQGSLTATKSSDTTYGSATVVTVSTTGGSGTGAVSFSTLSGACSVDSSTGVITIVTAGSCVVTATKAADANFNSASANVTITIAKASQATLIAGADNTSVTYNDGTSITVSTTGGSGTGSVTYASTTTGVCSVNSTTGVVSVITAGTCSITATKAADTNYLVATSSTSIAIAKAAQATLTASKTADTTYGSNTVITVSLSGGSGTGAKSYATSSSACTVNSTTGVITIVTAGDCVVTGTKAADTNYLVATATVTITIAKANQASATASATYSSTTFGDGSVNTISLTGGTGTGAKSYASTTASVCSVNSTTGVVSVITAGTCTITATKAADTNYNVATASISITINKANQAALSASSSTASVTYGASTVVTISTTGGSGTGSVSYSSNTPLVCSVDSATGVMTIVTAGTCTIAATKAADVSFNSISNTVSLTIAKASQASLSASASSNSATYGDGSSLSISVSGGSGTGNVSYASGNTAVCTVNASTGVVTVVTAGTCTITATKAADTNYNLATSSATITVAKASQSALSATGTTSITHTVAHTTTQITVSGGNGNGTVSYAVDSTSTGNCSVTTNGLVTELHAGTCVINITKAADTNYNLATTTFTVTVSKANQSALSVTGTANITYNATTASTSQLTVSGGTGTGSITYSETSSDCSVSATGVVTALSAGSCVITVTKAGDTDFNEVTASYTVTIAKASQAVLIVRTTADLAFDPNSAATTSISVTGGNGTGSVTLSTTSNTCSVSGTTVTALGAGACVLSVVKATDTNYLEATTSFTFIITKSLQTPLSATPSKTELHFADTNNNTATISVSGGSGTGATTYFVSGATNICSVNASANPVVVTALAAGDCVITVTKAGDADFEAATKNITITIAKETQSALTVSSDKTNAIKNQTATLSATGGSTTGTVTYSVVTGATVCQISGSTLTFTGAGTCTVKATRAGNANYYDVESNTITLTATKAEQNQLVVSQAAGMLPNVAIGGKNSTSWNITGGNGTGALSVTNVTGCNASITAGVLTATAGTVAGDCTIDIAKAESTDYNATTYRVSLMVYSLPGAASIGTPALNLTTDANGVGVDIPFTPANTGSYVAPVTGYQLQTKTGTNWVNTDNGYIGGPLSQKISISVTPWTSIFVRVAAVSDYETANGSSRVWSTYGGATAQAFNVPGLITSLSSSEIAAKTAETITVNGAGYSQAATAMVEFTAAQPIFESNGVKSATVLLPATVKSATQLTFKYPGTFLPTGIKTMAATISVIGTGNMRSNAANVTLTSEEESFDIGFDLNKGNFAPKITTNYSGTFIWSFKTANNSKIFVVSGCVTYKTVKGKKVCAKMGLLDSATCSLTLKTPLNKTNARITYEFKSHCQLNTVGKLAVLNTTTMNLNATATFQKVYPKTGLTYILVKGKKTGILKPMVRLHVFKFGNKTIVRN